MRNLFLIFLVVIASKALGNGGPIDGSAVYKTGDIILINQPNISLTQEDLKIVIEGDYSLVGVTYYLKNDTHTDSEITYGFPIRFIRNELQYELEWQDDYLPEIEFLLNEEKLEIKHQVDLSTEQVEIEDHGTVDMRKSWHVVDFSILKGTTAVLKVNYKVKNGFEDWGTSKDFFPSFGERRMIYDFSPAKKWGDGIVSDFTVEIDARQVPDNSVNFAVSGLPLTNKSGIYAFSTKNFNLKEAKDLSISYDNETQKLSNFIMEHRISSDKIKSISATSTLEGNYNASNLLDADLATAWVEGKKGNGVGEQIVIELNDYTLSAICLINGYTKNQSTYTNNGKIKKIKLEREVVDYKDPSKTVIEVSEIALDNLAFKETSKNSVSEMMSILEDHGDGYQKVRKITLTILEVYEGAKHADTCISEVLILGYK